MHFDFQCEICGGDRWRLLGKKTYRLKDAVSDYVAKRYHVLFEVWFPGAGELVFSSCLCQRCGFICSTPRPDSKDIEAKYHALEELSQDYGSAESPRTQRKRAARLYSQLARHLPDRANILDFGGGDGRLMEPFSEAGHRPFLVDFNLTPKEYVTKLSSTLADLDPGYMFEAVVASHVIEHVAEPVQVMRQLVDRLIDGGLLLVEVPMEIWRKPPLQEEPVTHINFFVPGSLRRAMEESGLHVQYSRLASCLHPSGQIETAVVALGKKQTEPPSPGSSGLQEVAGFLNPTPKARLQRNWILRRKVPAALAYRVRRRNFRT